MHSDTNQEAFFELVRAGLWEKEARLSQFENIDYAAILKLAEEQSVVGLVTAGLEHVADVKVPQDVLLQFIGSTLQIEQQNKAMNEFVAKLIELLRKNDVYVVLVKGQGIAQCYERPLWRASGDVDLLLSDDNYEKAKIVLQPLAVEVGTEYKSFRHLEMIMKGGFVVELHGTLHARLTNRIDSIIDKAQESIIYEGRVRSWLNCKTQIFLPSPDNDTVFIFTHILQHFFVGGIGIRQFCDWCRLLYRYNEELDYCLLESQIKEAGLITEWKAFAAFAVDYLGMHVKDMPFYSPSRKWKKKANKISGYILETGNLGHNRDLTFRQESNALKRKLQTFSFLTHDSLTQFSIFPIDSIKAWWSTMKSGLSVVLIGE